MMSLWDALRMNMMISYQELVRTFLNTLNFIITFPQSLIPAHYMYPGTQINSKYKQKQEKYI